MTPADDSQTDLQIDEIELRDIGINLEELAKRLHQAAERLKGRVLLDPSVNWAKNEHEEMTDTEVAEENAETRGAFRDTLKAMRTFRREYDRWERLTTEFALTRLGYSQRDAARELGVATSTVNRWAQHPLRVEDYR